MLQFSRSRLQALLLLSGVCICSACGYRYTGMDSSEIVIHVPYILGDKDGVLQSALAYQLSSSGCFTCSGLREGTYALHVEIITDTEERIGFRYDRDNPSGKLEKNLLGTEDRRTVTARIFVTHQISKKTVLGPYEVSASVDFDYTDPGSPRDLLFAKTVPVMPFSLGQLDSQEGASEDTAGPLFTKLASYIVDGLVSQIEYF